VASLGRSGDVHADNQIARAADLVGLGSEDADELADRNWLRFDRLDLFVEAPEPHQSAAVELQRLLENELLGRNHLDMRIG